MKWEVRFLGQTDCDGGIKQPAKTDDANAFRGLGRGAFTQEIEIWANLTIG